MVLETCGVRDLVEGIPNDGIAFTVAASGKSPSWGSEPLTARGGKYRLCWCTRNSAALTAVEAAATVGNISDADCDSALSYNIDFGELSLLGPRPLQQDRTCLAGWPCNLEGFRGTGLDSLDAVMVLETCGKSSAIVPRWDAAGRSTPVDLRDGTTFWWGSMVVSASGRLQHKDGLMDWDDLMDCQGA